jgi:ABC-type Zn uptake system ZnuABC Zn-binding protein ZnuA
MKKIIILLITLLIITGCDWVDDFSDRYVYTTSYPIEYATNMLYKEHANISSVYPNGANETYEVTEKKKDKYSSGETFIYSGLSNEALLARDLLNKNGKLKIIDATKGISSNYSFTRVWLNPANYLMLCSNIKSSLIEYTDNTYVKEEIAENYDLLNEKISELDVQLYNIGKNGNYDTILTISDDLTFLTKYNINVISLDENNTSIDKSYADAKKMIEEKKIQYIYYIEGQTFNETQEKFISQYNLKTIEINDLFTLTEEERKEEKDYISLMNETIEKYKTELYK